MARKAWLFAGSELAGQRAAIIMSLVQSAKLHDREPRAYLKDVLTRLTTQLNRRIDELIPHKNGCEGRRQSEAQYRGNANGGPCKRGVAALDVMSGPILVGRNERPQQRSKAIQRYNVVRTVIKNRTYRHTRCVRICRALHHGCIEVIFSLR